MKVQILNPFLESINSVVSQEIGEEVQRGELRLNNQSCTTDEVTTLISMVGEMEGNVVFSLNRGTAMAAVTRMLGEEVTEFSDLAQSGVTELGNVIVGQASVRLARAGYQTNISPPTLILGAGATLSTLDYPRLEVPLLTEIGQITVHLALKESASVIPAGSAIATPDAPGG